MVLREEFYSAAIHAHPSAYFVYSRSIDMTFLMVYDVGEKEVSPKQEAQE